MSYDRYSTHLNNPTVGQFLVSGTPWLSGSVISGSEEQLIAFPSATRRIKLEIVNGGNSDQLRLHFLSTSSAGGANIVNNRHFWVVHPSASFDANIRVNNAYVTVVTQSSPTSLIQYAVFAELTNITGSELAALTR